MIDVHRYELKTRKKFVSIKQNMFLLLTTQPGN